MSIQEKIKDDDLSEMNKYFKEIHIVNNRIKHSIFQFIKSIFIGKPYILYKFQVEEIRNKILEYKNKFNIDLLFCDHIYLAQNIPDGLEKQIPVIPNNEDHAFTYYKRLTSSGGITRPLYASAQWKKLLKYEVGIYKKYGIDITTSEKEKELLMQHDGSLNIKVVPNGVDLEYYSPRERTNSEPNVVFTAWYKYYPNQQAAVEFARNIFPLVKEKIKDFKFYIVGKEPPEEVKRLAEIEGVVVTGEVPDVRPFIADSDAVVIPLRIGGGTRLKILEAMGMAKPVISTTLGAEGLNASDGENILIADEYNIFAEYIIKLINDKELNMKLAADGRKFVEEFYGWDRIGDELNHIIEDFYSEFKSRTDK